MKTNKMKKSKIVLVAVLTVALLISAVVFTACSGKQSDTTLKFIMPDGTPALAASKFFEEGTTINGHNVSTEIVAPTALGVAMIGGKADILIAPTNMGVAQIIKNKADYKLVSVAVEGSLHIIAKPAQASGKDGAVVLDDLKGKKLASIGNGSTPDLVLKYILAENNIAIGTGDDQVEIIYAADGPNAKAMLDAGQADLALVGEPAATQFGIAGGYTSRLDMQQLYAKASGNENFAQASVFVKSELAKDSAFMGGLSNLLGYAKTWVGKVVDEENEDEGRFSEVNDYMKSIGSLTAFPFASLDKCNLANLDASNKSVQDSILAYLKIVGMNIPADKVANIFA